MESQNGTNLPELLAPAGDYDALLAALSSGADAIYLGVEQFNARRNAQNFTLETLREACDLAHLARRRVYLTLNTAILPGELDSAMELARQAWWQGVDALIVQDLGLLTRLARELPQLELHASTQMNIHSSQGVAYVHALGAKRVTLSRELGLDELAVLATTGVELEVFAHGALCFCYSGQCLMSSLIGRRSANRGLCAQPCRLPYSLIDSSTGKHLPTEGNYLLSPSDLSTREILPQLVATGVRSLKIEGRMKSASYVATVVRVYRSALDALAQQGEQDTLSIEEENVAHDELAEVFSRGFTTAYLEGDRSNTMMGYQRPNNRGVQVGRVAQLGDGLVGIDLSKRVVKGDSLEFWTTRGRCVVTLDALYANAAGKGATLDRAPEGSRVFLRIPQPVSKGDRVFRVRNSELLQEAAEAYGSTLMQGNNGFIAVDVRVRVRQGQPLAISFTLASDGIASGAELGDQSDELGDRGGAERGDQSDERGAEMGSGSPSQPVLRPSSQLSPPEGAATGPVVEAARTKALTAKEVREQVGRVGGTPFSIRNWDIELDEGVGLSFSTLHKVRAHALAELEDAVLAPWHTRLLDAAPPQITRSAAQRRAPQIAALVRDTPGAQAAAKAGAEAIYLHTLQFEAGQDTTQLPLKGKLGALPLVHVLPAISHDRELAALSNSFAAEKTVLANNLAELSLALKAGAPVEAGPSLGIYNDATLAWLADVGATRAWLSPELSLNDIKLLAPHAPLPLAMTIVGQQELM
ncbi:MAG: U32 family peptidase, partial [Coriobacteriales bacterium]|nr:U32 family peptidase [Coriobacteriales bacterium]